MGVTWIILIAAYLAIGVYAMMYIRKDNEFRESEVGEIFAYSSVLFWPLTYPLWFVARPPEQLEDLGAKKTYQDFKNFLKKRKAGEGDLLAGLEKTSPEKPYELKGNETESDFRDHHIEELIRDKQYQEALRTSNDMLRFAREQQEHDRIEAYERYIRQIKDKRKLDLGSVQ